MGNQFCKNCPCPKATPDITLPPARDSRQIGQYDLYQGPEITTSLNHAFTLFERQEGFTSFMTTYQWYKHIDRDEYYFGDWVDGVKRGKGILLDKGRTAYYGDFDQVPKGKGKFIYLQPRMLPERDTGYFQFKGLVENQTLIEGDIEVVNVRTRERVKKVKLRGLNHNGVIVYDDGKYYTGGIDHQMLTPQGEGKMLFKDQSSYEGRWQLGRPHESGIYKYAGGDVYQGSFKDGLRHGEGRLNYKDNSYYQGEWVDDQQEGEGTLRDNRGKVIFSGRWEAGRQIPSN